MRRQGTNCKRSAAPNLLCHRPVFTTKGIGERTGLGLAISCSAVQMNDGWHALGLIRDITERKRVDDELRRKEYLLSESQRLCHIGSFLFELSGTIQWSDEVYRIFGVLPDTFTPTMEFLLGLIHPGDQQSMQDWNAACAAGEKPGPLDYRINRPDGTMRYVRGWGEVVLDNENRPIYLAGIGQDVTEQKRAEEKIRQYVSELAEKNKELQDVLADIKQLTGMLPICASCKKIKDDKGNILATTAITIANGSEMIGRALGQTNVPLIDNTITAP